MSAIALLCTVFVYSFVFEKTSCYILFLNAIRKNYIFTIRKNLNTIHCLTKEYNNIIGFGGRKN